MEKFGFPSASFSPPRRSTDRRARARARPRRRGGRRCAHRQCSSGAKGNHLAETAGDWESAAIRQTSLAPADYLKAQPPLSLPPPPTISFPKSVARIIKLVEERRERDAREREAETSSLATHSCQPSATPSSPSFPPLPAHPRQPTCCTRSIVASLGLFPLCSYLHPSRAPGVARLPSFLPPCHSLLFLSPYFLFRLGSFREGNDRGRVEFRVSTASYGGTEIRKSVLH